MICWKSRHRTIYDPSDNRRVLNGLLEKCGLQEHAVGILRALDKLDKIGRDAVAAEMIDKAGTGQRRAAGAGHGSIERKSPAEILQKLEGMLAGSRTGEQGLQNLRELFAAVDACGWPAGRVNWMCPLREVWITTPGTNYETFHR